MITSRDEEVKKLEKLDSKGLRKALESLGQSVLNYSKTASILANKGMPLASINEAIKAKATLERESYNLAKAIQITSDETRVWCRA